MPKVTPCRPKKTSSVALAAYRGMSRPQQRAKSPWGSFCTAALVLGLKASLCQSPPSLPKSYKCHTRTYTHQAKAVGLCIGLEAIGATWCHSPLSLQRSCALIKLTLCLGAQVLAMLARHSVQRRSTVECYILTWRPDVCCLFTLRFTFRMQVLGQKWLKERLSHSVDRHSLDVF